MKLPLEVTIHIIEDACIDDFGRTARNIGLVSKCLRSIAQPLELRSVAVSGLKQLEGFSARTQAESSEDGAGEGSSKYIKVQHLFISELTEEDALALEVPSTPPAVNPSELMVEYDAGRGEFAEMDRHVLKRKLCNGEYLEMRFQRKWEELKQSYNNDADRFWSLATVVVRRASPTLRSLSLLAAAGWFQDRLPTPERLHRTRERNVLSCLSGVSFPNLVYLAVDHNVERDAYNSISRFQTPVTPKLRRLHIRSLDVVLWKSYPVPWRDAYVIHHLFRDIPPELREAHLCGGDVFIPVIRCVFGTKSDWTTAAGSRLPGKLQSLVLQGDFFPQRTLHCTSHHELKDTLDRYFEESKMVTEKVEKLSIDGLEARLPYWDPIKFHAHRPYWTWFPEAVQRRYKPMLAEMAKECRNST